MTTFEWETREQWRAVPPRNRRSDTSPRGVAIHYPGPGKYVGVVHEICQARMRSWQDMHMKRGSNDLEYGLVLCEHLRLMEGRVEQDKPWVRVGSNGTAAANATHTSIQLMRGTMDPPPTEQEITALGEAVAWLRENGKWGPEVTGHRDHYATACPGDPLYSRLDDIKAIADRIGRDPADRDKERHVGYRKITADLKVPAKKWVRLGHVNSISRGPALYVAQFAVEKGIGGGWCQVRFSRNGKDGTGDQDYRYKGGRGVFNISHNHALLGGFDGRMDTLFWSSKPVTIKYRILKSIAL